MTDLSKNNELKRFLDKVWENKDQIGDLSEAGVGKIYEIYGTLNQKGEQEVTVDDATIIDFCERLLALLHEKRNLQWVLQGNSTRQYGTLQHFETIITRLGAGMGTSKKQKSDILDLLRREFFHVKRETRREVTARIYLHPKDNNAKLTLMEHIISLMKQYDSIASSKVSGPGLNRCDGIVLYMATPAAAMEIGDIINQMHHDILLAQLPALVKTGGMPKIGIAGEPMKIDVLRNLRAYQPANWSFGTYIAALTWRALLAAKYSSVKMNVQKTLADYGKKGGKLTKKNIDPKIKLWYEEIVDSMKQTEETDKCDEETNETEDDGGPVVAMPGTKPTVETKEQQQKSIFTKFVMLQFFLLCIDPDNFLSVSSPIEESVREQWENFWEANKDNSPDQLVVVQTVVPTVVKKQSLAINMDKMQRQQGAQGSSSSMLSNTKEVVAAINGVRAAMNGLTNALSVFSRTITIPPPCHLDSMPPHRAILAPQQRHLAQNRCEITKNNIKEDDDRVYYC